MRFVRMLALLALPLVAAAPGCRRSPEVTVTAAPDTHAGAGARPFVVTELDGSGPFADLLRGELGKARARGLRPFLYVGATWCAPCRAIQASLDDPRMVEAFRGTYQIHVDFDRWKDGLRDGRFPVEVIPAFFRVDERGAYAGATVDGGAWDDSTPDHMAPVLRKFFHG